jgi:hypothetical protein
VPHATRHQPAPAVSPDDPSSWTPERCLAGVRIMTYLWATRRARWNKHRFSCKACLGWVPASQDIPDCPEGAQALNHVRVARQAIRLMNERLDAAADPQPALF